MNATTASILTWNTQFAPPRTARGKAIRGILEARNGDVVVLTEAFPDTLTTGGYVIYSSADYGYRTNGHCRKVVLWSKCPWRDTDDIGHPDLPSGRFIGGSTETPLVVVRVLGVCIPWKDAHVHTGRKDRLPWEDHLKYLSALGHVLRGVAGHKHVIVAGDWNQRLPAARVPLHVSETLARTFKNMSIATAGPLPPLQRHAIDHVAHTPALISCNVESWSEHGPNNARLSDHFGVAVRVRSAVTLR